MQFPAAFLFALAPIAGASFPTSLHQVAVEPTSAHIQIDAVALDRNNMPVLDLRPDELEVWINGYRVPIETLAVVTPNDEERGRLIVLVLDDVTVAPVLIPRVREVARRFVNSMSPEDRMAIVLLNGGGMESSGDRDQLLRTIAAYTMRTSGVIRLDDLSKHVLETIASLSRQLAEASNRRKTIVAIGAEWLFDRPMPPPAMGRDLRREWTDAMRAMAFAKVNLYVIDPSGVGMSRAAGGSSGFAREAGGYAFTNTNDLNAAADRIMREAASYYLIGVADPPVGRKADLRELDVRVLRRGVSIRARRAIPGIR